MLERFDIMFYRIRLHKLGAVLGFTLLLYGCSIVVRNEVSSHVDNGMIHNYSTITGTCTIVAP